MPAVTVVAKRFTLVQAAQAAEFKRRSFILLEAFCLMPHSCLIAVFLRFRRCPELTRDMGESRRYTVACSEEAP